MNKSSVINAPEATEAKAPEAPEAPEAKAKATEATEAKAKAEFLKDAAQLKAGIISAFIDGLDNEDRAYAKAEMLVSAKALHISAVGLIADITARIAAGKPKLDENGNPIMVQAVDTEGNPEIDTEGNPVLVVKMVPIVGKAPSAGLLSQYRGGWEMMTKAGLNPVGNAHLVSLGFKAKAGTLNLFKVDIDNIIDEVKVLPEASRLDRMLSLLEGSHPVQTKTPPIKAEPVTVSAFLTDALGAIPTLSTEALAEATKAARIYLQTAEAEDAARVAKAEAETAEAETAERVTAVTE